MGKGQIIAHKGDGLYDVRLTYAYRSRITSRLATYTVQIAEFDVKIAAETDVNKKALLKLQRASIQKLYDYYSTKMPADPTVEAWCADLTEDLAYGTVVGTVEIPGEQVTVLVRPAYNNRAVYSAARDGQLMPAIAGSPHQVLFNWLILPGWQRHKPVYRTGTISAIDYDANTCTVCLDPAFSSQQNLPAVDGVSVADCGATAMAAAADFCSRYPTHPFCTNSDEGSEISLTTAQLAQLQMINSDVNLNYGRQNDPSGYRMGDSWDVMPTGGSGDCEDFALTKMQALVDTYGWSPSNLKLVACYTKTGEYHAMLGVRTTNYGLMILDVNNDPVVSSTKLPYRIDKIALTATSWKNYTRQLADVPIEYMQCNSYAFAAGDRVVVQFVDQEWETPKVIGFETDPQPCAFGVAIFPSPYNETIQTGVVFFNGDGSNSAQVRAELNDFVSVHACASSGTRALKMGGATYGNPYSIVSSVKSFNPINDSIATQSSQPSSVWYHAGFSQLGNGFYAFGLNGKLSDLDIDKNTDCNSFSFETNSWSGKSSPGENAINVSFFTIGNSSYSIGGWNPDETNLKNILKKYDSTIESWLAFGSSADFRVADYYSFSANSKGYFGAGVDDFNTTGEPVNYNGVLTYYNDKFRQYDPTADSWSIKTPRVTSEQNTRLCGSDGTGVFGYTFGDAVPINISYIYKYGALSDAWSTDTITPALLISPSACLV